MAAPFIISEYISSALVQAEYDKLEDGTFVGRIPLCKGVIAFGSTLNECENELRSTLEDWLLVGFKLGQRCLSPSRPGANNEHYNYTAEDRPGLGD